MGIHARHPLKTLDQLNGPLALGLVLHGPTQVDDPLVRVARDRQRADLWVGGKAGLHLRSDERVINGSNPNGMKFRGKLSVYQGVIDDGLP